VRDAGSRSLGVGVRALDKGRAAWGAAAPYDGVGAVNGVCGQGILACASSEARARLAVVSTYKAIGVKQRERKCVCAPSGCQSLRNAQVSGDRGAATGGRCRRVFGVFGRGRHRRCTLGCRKGAGWREGQEEEEGGTSKGREVCAPGAGVQAGSRGGGQWAIRGRPRRPVRAEHGYRLSEPPTPPGGGRDLERENVSRTGCPLVPAASGASVRGLGRCAAEVPGNQCGGAGGK